MSLIKAVRGGWLPSRSIFVRVVHGERARGGCGAFECVILSTGWRGSDLATTLKPNDEERTSGDRELMSLAVIKLAARENEHSGATSELVTATSKDREPRSRTAIKLAARESEESGATSKLESAENEDPGAASDGAATENLGRTKKNPQPRKGTSC